MGKRINYNDDDSEEDDDHTTRSKKRRHESETKTKEHKPNCSRQYRDRAKERREGLQVDEEGEEDAPPASVADALFDAATLAVETGQMAKTDVELPGGTDRQMMQTNGYLDFKDRTLATQDQALDWLQTMALNNNVVPQPKSPLARNICQWLHEQHMPSSQAKVSTGNKTLQNQLQRSCYEFRSRPASDLWTPPVLDNAAFREEEACEPWDPMPDELLTQIETSIAQIHARTAVTEAKDRVLQLNAAWVRVETTEDDIFVGAGTHYNPEAATHDDDEKKKTIPFQNPLGNDAAVPGGTQQLGVYNETERKQGSRLVGFSESNTLDEALFVGVVEGEDEGKKTKKRRSRSRRKADDDSD